MNVKIQCVAYERDLFARFFVLFLFHLHSLANISFSGSARSIYCFRINANAPSAVLHLLTLFPQTQLTHTHTTMRQVLSQRRHVNTNQSNIVGLDWKWWKCQFICYNFVLRFFSFLLAEPSSCIGNELSHNHLFVLSGADLCANVIM